MITNYTIITLILIHWMLLAAFKDVKETNANLWNVCEWFIQHSTAGILILFFLGINVL